MRDSKAPVIPIKLRALKKKIEILKQYDDIDHIEVESFFIGIETQNKKAVGYEFSFLLLICEKKSKVKNKYLLQKTDNEIKTFQDTNLIFKNCDELGITSYIKSICFFPNSENRTNYIDT